MFSCSSSYSPSAGCASAANAVCKPIYILENLYFNIYNNNEYSLFYSVLVLVLVYYLFVFAATLQLASELSSSR
jgi:hypothetical protein